MTSTVNAICTNSNPLAHFNTDPSVIGIAWCKICKAPLRENTTRIHSLSLSLLHHPQILTHRKWRLSLLPNFLHAHAIRMLYQRQAGREIHLEYGLATVSSASHQSSLHASE